MNKQLDKLKKQLLELSEPVNAFTSEAVQLKVIDKALNYLTRLNKQDAEIEFNIHADTEEAVSTQIPKVIGHVEAINELESQVRPKYSNNY